MPASDSSCGSVHIISISPSGLLGFGTSLVFLSIGIVLCFMTVEVCAITDRVQVVATDNGLTVEDPLVVSFCNDSDNIYTIVLECTTKGRSLIWTSEYFDKHFNIQSEPCNQKDDPKDENAGFTFLLNRKEYLNDTEKNILYVSQLWMNTNTLVDLIPHSGQINVTCQALNTKSETVLIKLSGIITTF